MASMASISRGSDHHQGLTGQGPSLHRAQLQDAVLGPGQVVTVEDLGAIARQNRRHLAAQGGVFDDAPSTWVFGDAASSHPWRAWEDAARNSLEEEQWAAGPPGRTEAHPVLTG